VYAIIKTGGKQYRVEEGQMIKVEKLPLNKDDTVEFTEILSVVNEDGPNFGSPYIEGAKVTGKVIEQGKAKKIVVFKYKPKKRYRRKIGHRQPYTRVLIQKIES